MKALTFILAILFAIPTFGISLAIYIMLAAKGIQRDMKVLVRYLALALDQGGQVEVRIPEPAAVKHLFKTYAVGDFDEQRFPSEKKIFSGTLLVPEIGPEIIVSLLHNRRTGVVMITCSKTFDWEPNIKGETAYEKLKRIKEHYDSV